MDSASSSSGSASPSPEPESLAKNPKGKSKAQEHTGSQHGKNEGVNPNWAYKPPADAVPLDHTIDFGEFDWDEVKANDDCELWLIRVPTSVKPKHLDGLSIEVPPPLQNIKVGSLKRKHATFDVWSVGTEETSDQPLVGEEIRNLQCLLPRKRKGGKLFRAPKPIARHLVLSAQPVTPLSSDDAALSAPMVYQNPPRPSYPKELLKHRFMPYGSMGNSELGKGLGGDSMDVDAEALQTSAAAIKQGTPEPPQSPKAEKKAKTKKRKGDGEPSSPKKTKKVKTKGS